MERTVTVSETVEIKNDNTCISDRAKQALSARLQKSYRIKILKLLSAQVTQISQL